MQHYAPWNPNRQLASIEEILGSETEEDALSHTSDESELVDSENGTSPKLLEAAESDTDGHSVSSTVRMTSTLEWYKLTACKGERNAFNGITVLDTQDVDGPGGRTHQYLVKCWIQKKHMDLFFELVRMSWCHRCSIVMLVKIYVTLLVQAASGPFLSPLVPELYNKPSIGS